ncbi:MAG: DUF4105 domain-containing protein [Gammaproteobacteria bacterium]
MNVSLGQAAIALLGVLHAAAAYFYFSKERFAGTWALGWLVLTAVAVAMLPAHPYATACGFGLALAAWTTWWVTIRPLASRTWVADNAFQATGMLVGEQLSIHHRRNFTWRTKTDFTATWDDARYALGELDAVDLFVSSWGDPRIAHLIVSFVFRNGETLAFSIETRRETTEKWSGLAGFMKSYELIIIAAPESDLIRVRTNIRHETVHRYRLVSTPMMRRRLLNRYLRQMNRLARRPRFYNTLFCNCTTEIARILGAAGRHVPFAWPLIVSGYAPEYFHRIGLIDPSRPLAAHRAEGDIGARARAEPSDVPYSRRIRQRGPVAVELRLATGNTTREPGTPNPEGVSG